MVKPDSPPKKRWRPPTKHRKARVGESDVFSWEAAAVLCFVAVAAALAFQHEGLRTRLAHLLWLPRDADELVEEASIRRLERSEFAHDRETAALLRSVQQKPDDAVRWFRLGSYMHAARGDRNSAHREFLKAIELAAESGANVAEATGGVFDTVDFEEEALRSFLARLAGTESAVGWRRGSSAWRCAWRSSSGAGAGGPRQDRL